MPDDDEPWIDWAHAPICIQCSKEIVNDDVADKTGEPVCSWDCLWKFEDEGIVVD